MDRIIALYPTPDVAEHARTRLDMEGIPTDRLDVVSLEDPDGLRIFRSTLLPKT